MQGYEGIRVWKGDPGMALMIKLKLVWPEPTLDKVARLPGMAGLTVDRDFGLICISPQEQLYVVRVDAIDHVDERKNQSPEIAEVYGDTRISVF
jgi:hypothetical protein